MNMGDVQDDLSSSSSENEDVTEGDEEVSEEVEVERKEVTEEEIKEKSEKTLDYLKALEYINGVIKDYQILRPTYEDVSPSFADEVPFLVDGDSLMATVMEDNNWSNQLGGSILHLVYLVERHLNVFIQRGGKFHIVFFDCWRNVWGENWNILFYRQVLINHFSKNTEYKVHLFNNCFDKSFLQLISDIRPSFMLTYLDVHNDDNERLKGINVEYLTNMTNIQVLIWLDRDLTCIDTNYIKVDSSLVKGFYINCHPILKQLVRHFVRNFVRFFKDELPKYDEIQLPVLENTNDFDARTVITLLAGWIFHTDVKNEEFLKLFFLNTAVMNSLELKNRCCPLLKESLEELDEVVRKWLKCLFLALSNLGDIECNWVTVSDLWQGLLFGHVCRIVANGIENAENLGKQVASAYENIVEKFNHFGFEIKPYPITMNLNIKWDEYKPTDAIYEPSSLQHIDNPLVMEFCGSVLRDIRWADPPPHVLPLQEYSEQHHYHSMKVVEDEHDRIKDSHERIPTDPWEKKKYEKMIQKERKYMSLYGTNIEGKQLESRPIIRNSIKEKDKKEKKEKKIGKKGQDIINKNKKSKLSEAEMQEKKDLDKFETEFKKKDNKSEALLNSINLIISRIHEESSNRVDSLVLKLKVLLRALKGKKESNSGSINEVRKEIFLTARKALSICPGNTMSAKQQEVLSKSLCAIECHEIARRNGLPVNPEGDTGVSKEAWVHYQLQQLGPELVRTSTGQPDSRVVGFIPDPWQKTLFDAVDKRESAVIIAPTSSGKTYASYYCMESVLRESAEGIVVYVSPTKALVNQVAATVYARFKDTDMPAGRSVYGVLTRDYRTHAMTSQILITVPQCLEILLMSPRRHSWVQNLRYVIFDEIHCIAGNLGGVAWERCLLLIRCPFLALSATIRHPENLHGWLQTAELYKQQRDIANGCERKSYRIHLVIHSERHSDLTKYTYRANDLHHMHPYANLEASVMKLYGGIPPHMTLSPAETLKFYEAMCFANAGSVALRPFAPEVYFSKKCPNGFITRSAVREYELELSSLLTQWFNEQETINDYNQTIDYLRSGEMDRIVGTGKLYIKQNIVDFVLNLKQKKMLPTIIFVYDRKLIEELMFEMTKYFLRIEDGPDRRTEKKNEKLEKIEKKKTQQQAAKDKVVSKTRQPKARLNILSGGANSLKGVGIGHSADIENIEFRLLRVLNPKSKFDRMFVNAMKNGVCMHHSGMNSKKRSSVEMLFRLKVLNVVFATGTLAQGIHMPCKTTVIAGDSPYLNSLEYHQMSGRAGRRGFDTAGNVVFLGLNPRKQHTLLTAQLPEMNGNFPINVSLILRLLLLVADVTEKGEVTEECKKITVSRVMTLLENSLVFRKDKQLITKIKHFFSFSLQLLKMQEFISDTGVPYKWCGLATHLHYHEPGNFAFVYLLRTGVIRRICTGENKAEILNTLVLVLSYLFTKVPLKVSVAANMEFKNSKVILDPLPDDIKESLEMYNAQVRFVFDQYFANVAAQFTEPDNILPVSMVPINAINTVIDQDDQSENLHNHLLNLCVPKLMCSSFSALSGNGDDNLYSDDNLVSNIKQTISTDEKIIPLINTNAELNGYAADFFRHGIVASIREDNNLKAGHEFDYLVDFMLVIKTIVTSLTEMQVKDENDPILTQFRKLEEKYSDMFRKNFVGYNY